MTLPNVLEGVEVTGDLNTPMDRVLEHIRYAIRQGHPQVRVEPLKAQRVALVGSGPSLEETLPELQAAYFAGAKVVTMNRAYHWCRERNIRPSAQIVLDAKRSTANFVTPETPQCLYLVASQCHPDVWDAVQSYEKVAIWHSLNPDHPEADVLDKFYGSKHGWCGIVGGTTVATRALMLLRTMGYCAFDVFGVDSCWLGEQHHAMDQPENQKDRKLKLTITPTRGDMPPREFLCAPWHVQQLKDVLEVIRANGQHFMLNVHGPGLIAYALQAGAAVQTHIEPAEGV